MKKLKLFFACLLMAVLSIGQVWGETVTYTVTSTSAVSTTGTAPDGASATYSQTYNTAKQATSGNSFTLTLSGYEGHKITAISLSMKSNSSKGAGSLSVQAGSTTICSIDNANFNTSSWYGAWSTNYVPITPTMTDDDYEIQENENVVFTISCTTNSLYCESYTITYEEAGSTCETLGAPQNPSATPAQTSVVLSWDAVTGASGYKVVFNGTEYNVAADVTTKTIEELAMEKEYHWTVAAKGDGTTYCASGTATAQQSVTTLDACSANKAVYTVASTSSVTSSSGALAGSSATFANTYSTKEQMTSGNSQTLTLSGYDGATIKGLTLSMHSNAKAGAGTFSLVIGSTTVAEISDATNFNEWFDNESYGSDYRNVHVPFASDVVVGTGENIQVVIAATTNSLFCQSFSFCYADPAPVAVQKPTFTVAGGSYLDAQSVELECATTGAEIRYTLDGTDPDENSTLYEGAIAVSSTTTISAIAILGENSSGIASATYTIVTPSSVDEIWNSITADGPEDAYVWGYVSQTNVKGYDNNFYISVDGSTEGNQLYAYRMDMNSFSVAIGDKVILNGDLTIFGEDKEFKYTNSTKCGKILRLTAKGAVTGVEVSGTATKTTYSANETFETAGLVVTATYENDFSGVVTEGITWGDNLTDHKVAATGNVAVTATVGGQTSAAYNVAVEVSAKTVSSIAAAPATYTIYTGETLPQPTITAVYSEGEPADVSAEATYDSENVFDTNNTGEQTITVSYTFGENTVTTTYTVTVVDYANADDAPYTVAEALYIITNAIGNVESASEIVVTGTVSADNISNYKNRYKISDGTNELLVYGGKGFNSENFTAANYPKVGDVVVVKGNVINYNNNTPEFATGKSYLLSQVRPATLTIEAVTGFEVGAEDMAEADLTITTASDGAITFEADAQDAAILTIVNNAIHAVGAGTATVTANLAATANEGAMNYTTASTTFDVTVVAAPVKYSITFDGNGADDGSAPAAIADKAENASVTLPANTWTKTGYTFKGWKVTYLDDMNETQVVPVNDGAFSMPAFDVTIQAQWEEIPVWAYTYNSNVTLTDNSTNKCYSEGVTIETDDYDGLRIATGSAAGSATITVPAHTTKLHFHVAGWKDVTGSIDVNLGGSKLATITLIADDGINQSNGNKAPYALENDPVGYYSYVAIPDSETPTEIVFSAGSGKRAVIFGVNQEGGVLPVLESIEIKGDLDTKTGYKAGQALDLTGLTVEATYSLAGVNQTPVDITDKLNNGLTLTYDPLVENQTEVTITATYGEKTDDITITLEEAVASADPKIYVDKLNVNFGSVEVGDAVPAAQTVTVTLTNVAAVTATLGGTNADAFSVSPASLTESGDITISILANTDAAASYSATLTISDGEDGAVDKTVNLSFAVTEPVTPEDPEVRKTWDLSIASYDANPTEEQVTWSATYVNMVADKFNSSTAANNYLGGDANHRTSSRFYKDSKLTITPNDKEIISVVFTATSETYASALKNSDWTNASAAVDSKTVTVTPTDGKIAISTVIGGTCGFTAVQVNYKTPTPTTYTVTYDLNGGTGTTPTQEAVEANTEITLHDGETGITAPEGREFGGWLCNIDNKLKDAGASYTMTAANTTFTARWKYAYTTERENLEIGRYYTICMPKNIVAHTGATFWSIDSKNMTLNIITLVEETGELKEGMPYIFRATAAELKCAYGDKSESMPKANNGLQGTFDGMNAVNYGSYVLSNNKLWEVDGPVSLGANRAYIVLDQISDEPVTGNVPGRRRVSMALPEPSQTPTGIDVLDVQAEGVQKVVVDGQLYIVRDGKVFDTTGRLVK